MKDFTKNVEKLIDPINVGTLHFIQFFNSLLPTKIQNKLINKSSKKSSYMGFVVEPYSHFLCYELLDVKMAEKLLPSNFKLIKCKIFDDDIPKYYCIFGCINAHTSAFFGLRVEFYIMAEDINTGLLSWVIIDYDTNTISYDKKRGLTGSSCINSFITTDYDGILYANIIRNDNSRRLIFNSNTKNMVLKKLDQRLWLEGNLSIGYGANLSEKNGDVFSLKFDPKEVEKAYNIVDFEIKENNWYKGLYDINPSHIVCFPYAQHFLSDSPGHSSNLKTKEELVKSIESIDFKNIKVFSTKIFKIMFLFGAIFSFILTTILIILLILK